MISRQEAVVYYASTRKKRYFSMRAAINAEAKAVILNRYPNEPFESDTGHFYSIEIDEPLRYSKLHRRLSRLIKRAYKKAQPMKVRLECTTPGE